MRVVLRLRDVIVVDDFLSTKELRVVQRAAERETYSFINAATWDKVYQLSDGRPLEAPIYIFPPAAAEQAGVEPAPAAFSLFLNLLVTKSARLAPWLTLRRAHFELVTMRCQLSPAGTMLDWHGDSRARLGAYTYYVHREWRERWGGELLVADTASMKRTRQPRMVAGVYIPPRPNRLVLLRPGTPHMIKRVELAAGDANRIAIAGAYVRSPGTLARYRR